MTMEDRKALYVGYKELIKSFTQLINNRMIVKISGDNKRGIDLMFEGMRTKQINQEKIRIPIIDPAFQFFEVPTNDDNYLRLSCTFKFHPTGV